jgi:hypothetical protein
VEYDKKLKAVVTTTLVYEPNPENYIEGLKGLLGYVPTIEDMAKADLENLKDDSAWVVEDFNSNTTVEILIVEE